MELGAAGAALDIDVGRDELAAGAACGPRRPRSRRAWSRQRSSAAYRKATRCAVDASGGSEIRVASVRARSMVSIVEPA